MSGKNRWIQKRSFDGIPELARLSAMMQIRAPRLARDCSIADLADLIMLLRRLFANWASGELYLPDLLHYTEAAKRLGRSPYSLMAAKVRDAVRDYTGTNGGVIALLTPLGAGSLTFYRKAEVEALVSKLADRRQAQLAERARRAAACVPLDGIPLRDVAARFGISTYAFVKPGRFTLAARLRPFMRQTPAGYWYSTEADLAEFEAAIKADKAPDDEVTTLQAASILGLSKHGVWKLCRRQGVVAHVRHVDHPQAYHYRRSDILALIPVVQAAKEPPARAGIPSCALSLPDALKMIGRNRTPTGMQAIIHRADDGQRYVWPADFRLFANTLVRTKVPSSLIPDAALPIRAVLQKIGISRRTFEKCKLGLRSVPIPVYHKAPSGRLYVWPADLDAFLNEGRRMIVVPTEARLERKRIEKREWKASRRTRPLTEQQLESKRAARQREKDADWQALCLCRPQPPVAGGGRGHLGL